MIAQEKMYQCLYNNQEYVTFIINELFKKAEPNEKTYFAMQKPSVYYKFLLNYYPELKKHKKSVMRILKKPQQFWLKKDYACYFCILKLAKTENCNLKVLLKTVTETKLINGFFGYLTFLNKHTSIKEQTLKKIVASFEKEGIVSATTLIIKLKLIK